MADIESNIKVNIDTSEALAQLKLLQQQISAFQQAMRNAGAANARSASQMQQNLVNSINATGAFRANIQTIQSTAESFTTALEKNKLSIGEYFRYAGASSKSFGKLFKSEFETINQVAIDRVKTLQTQYIKLGRDANGALKAISVRPLALDMENLSTKTQIAAQRQQLFNQLMKQGSTQLLNFGKNTQWAGRQLTVGFTVPLVMMGTAAAKAYMQIEQASVKFKRVYGDMNTTTAEANKMVKAVQNLATEYTKFGVAVADTMDMAANAAAMGKTGNDLLQQVQNATKLAVLGGVDQNQALQTTISLTNAFGVSTKDLSSNIDFLNAVENQTVLSIEDMTTAIPKAAPVVKQLGGNVKDLAFFLTAMREGGISAAEGANAIKSGLASMINPTAKASAFMQQFGINVKGIVDSDKGNVRKTVLDMAKAFDTLDPLNRARGIEMMFGKFQFARISTLFKNVIDQGSQANKVAGLANETAQELAILSEREMKKISDSPMYKFQKAIQDIQLKLAPIGEAFLKAVTPLIGFVGKILDGFNGLSDGAKQFASIFALAVGAIGPVLLMAFGLVANGIANIMKLFVGLKSFFNKTTNATTDLGEQTRYMNSEQLKAAAVAASLDQAHAKLRQTFTSEAAAVQALTNAYRDAVGAQAAFSGVPGVPVGNPNLKPKKYANGVSMVPGPKGAGDIIPALLSPGEAVIPAKHAQKYAPVIAGMVAGNLPGFENGTTGAGMRQSIIGPLTQRQMEGQARTAGELEKISEEVMAGPYGKVPPTNYGTQITPTTGHSFPAFGVGGIYEKPDGTKVFVKPQMDLTSALAEMRGTTIARDAHGLESPVQKIGVMMDPTDPADRRRFIVLESAVDEKFANPGNTFTKDQYFKQLVASLLRGDKDLGVGNLGGNILADVGTAGVFQRASGKRMLGSKINSMEEQAIINLLGVKGGAKRFFAESTADIAKSMTPAAYDAAMKAEIRSVIPKLAKTIGGFGNLTPEEKAAYADMQTRLQQGLGIDWGKYQVMHSAVPPKKYALGSAGVGLEKAILAQESHLQGAMDPNNPEVLKQLQRVYGNNVSPKDFANFEILGNLTMTLPGIINQRLKSGGMQSRDFLASYNSLTGKLSKTALRAGVKDMAASQELETMIGLEAAKSPIVTDPSLASASINALGNAVSIPGTIGGAAELILARAKQVGTVRSKLDLDNGKAHDIFLGMLKRGEIHPNATGTELLTPFGARIARWRMPGGTGSTATAEDRELRVAAQQALKEWMATGANPNVLPVAQYKGKGYPLKLRTNSAKEGMFGTSSGALQPSYDQNKKGFEGSLSLVAGGASVLRNILGLDMPGFAKGTANVGKTGKPKASVFDIDDTLLDLSSFMPAHQAANALLPEDQRTKWYKEIAKNPKPIPAGIAALRAAQERGNKIILMTARPEHYDPHTIETLQKLGIDMKGIKLISRKDKDYRKPEQMKYDKTSRFMQWYDIEEFYDDMDKTRGAISLLGVKTYNPLKLANGLFSVPGPKGAGDVVPAMLSPGEAVIPADTAAQHRGLITQMIAGKLPGYANGTIVPGYEGGTPSVPPPPGIPGAPTPIPQEDPAQDAGWRARLNTIANGVLKGAAEGATKAMISGATKAGEILAQKAKDAAEHVGGKLVDKYLNPTNSYLTDSKGNVINKARVDAIKAQEEQIKAEETAQAKIRGARLAAIRKELELNDKEYKMQVKRISELDIKSAEGKKLTQQELEEYKQAKIAMREKENLIKQEIKNADSYNKDVLSLRETVKQDIANRKLQENADKLYQDEVKRQQAGYDNLTPQQQQRFDAKLQRKDNRETMKGQIQGITGKIAGIGMTATMALGALTQVPGAMGQIAQTALPAVGALSTMAGFIQGPWSLGIVSAVALIGSMVIAINNLDQAFKDSSTQAIASKNAIAGSTDAIRQLSVFAKTVTAGEMMDKVRSQRMVGITAAEGKTTFGESYVKSDQGQTFIKGLKDTIKNNKGATNQVMSDYANQLSMAVASGAVTAAQASSIAANVGAAIGDMNFAFKVRAQIGEIVGPNGENVKKDPIKVAAILEARSVKIMNQDITNLKTTLGKEKLWSGGDNTEGNRNATTIGVGALGAGVGAAAGYAGATAVAGMAAVAAEAGAVSMATAAAISAAVPVIGTLAAVGLGIAAVVMSYNSMIDAQKRAGAAAGAFIADAAIGLEQQKEMSDVIDKYYLKQIEVAKAEGNITQEKKLQYEYDKKRDALANINKNLLTNVQKNYTSADSTTQEALRTGMDTALQTKYKDNADQQMYLGAVAQGMKDNSNLSDAQRFTLNLQMESGNMMPGDIMKLVGLMTDKSMTKKIMKIVTDFSGTTGQQAAQAIGMIADKKLAANVALTISNATTDSEALKMIDLVSKVEQFNGVLSADVILNYLETNPEIAARMESLLTQFDQQGGKLTAKVAMQIDTQIKGGKNGNLDEAYFNKLSTQNKNQYLQVVESVIKVDPKVMVTTKDFKRWLGDEGQKLGSYPGEHSIQWWVDAYAKGRAYKVTKETPADALNVGGPAQNTGNNAGPQASFLDPYVEALRNASNWQQKLTVGFAASLKALRGQEGALGKFAGLAERLKSYGADSNFIQAALGGSQSDIDKIINHATGKLTKAGQDAIRIAKKVEEAKIGMAYVIASDSERAQKDNDLYQSGLDVISGKEKQINDKYDARAKVLDEIGKIQQKNNTQQQDTLSLADALSKGDIAAAAQAAMKAKQDNQAQALQDAKDSLEKARQNEVDSLQVKILGHVETRATLEKKIADNAALIAQSKLDELNSQIEIGKHAVTTAKKMQDILAASKRIAGLKPSVGGGDTGSGGGNGNTGSGSGNGNTTTTTTTPTTTSTDTPSAAAATNLNTKLASLKFNASTVAGVGQGKLINGADAAADALLQSGQKKNKLGYKFNNVMSVAALNKLRVANRISVAEYKAALPVITQFETDLKAAEGYGIINKSTTEDSRVVAQLQTWSTASNDIKAATIKTGDTYKNTVTNTLADLPSSVQSVILWLKDRKTLFNQDMPTLKTDISNLHGLTIAEAQKYQNMTAKQRKASATYKNFVKTGLVKEQDILSTVLDEKTVRANAKKANAFRQQLNTLGYTQANMQWAFPNDTTALIQQTLPTNIATLKHYSLGGHVSDSRYGLGTDTIPAMLTAGEYVIRKSAVDNIGIDKLNSMNSGNSTGESVYNYSITVNANSSDSSDIADAVLKQIKKIDSQRIRSNVI